jgi:hypothetical protein
MIDEEFKKDCKIMRVPNDWTTPYKKREQNRRYYQKNKKSVLEQQKKYRKTLKGRKAQKKYDISKKGKERRIKYKHSPKGRKTNKKYKHSIRGKETEKKYQHSSKGKTAKIREYSKRKKRFPIELSVEDMKFIKHRDNMKCVYCGIELLTTVPKGHQQQLTFDHIVNNGATDPSNLVLCCFPCNDSKKDKNVFEWCKKQGKPVPKIILELIKNG